MCIIWQWFSYFAVLELALLHGTSVSTLLCNFLPLPGFPVLCFAPKWMVSLSWGEVWQNAVGWLIAYCETRLCWTELVGLWPRFSPGSRCFLTFYLFSGLFSLSPCPLSLVYRQTYKVQAIHVRWDSKHASFVSPPRFLRCIELIIVAVIHSLLLPFFLLLPTLLLPEAWEKSSERKTRKNHS